MLFGFLALSAKKVLRFIHILICFYRQKDYTKAYWGDESVQFSKEYKLFCPSGMEVTVLEAGAALTGVCVPDRSGTFANVALPLKGTDDPSCAGVTLAPFAGRIAGGKMEIDGQTYQLTLNEGCNHLHGGFDALHKKRWQCEGRFEDEDVQEIAFSACVGDGVDGYPGNRRFTVTYRLWRDQRLEILLTATSDKPTRVNLSNHAYFNLSGDFEANVSDHLLEVNADEVYFNDEAFLMTGRGKAPPALNFAKMRRIGAPGGHVQLDGARGLNHCYVLRGGNDVPAAVLADERSGRRMRLFTDQPCVMVYSGGYLDNPNCAVALEAEEHPLSPYAPALPALYPGEVYRRRIVYQFDTVDEA